MAAATGWNVATGLIAGTLTINPTGDSNLSHSYSLDFGVSGATDNKIALTSAGNLNITLTSLPAGYLKAYYSLNGAEQTEVISGAFTVDIQKAQNDLLVIVIAENGFAYSKNITVVVEE